MVGERRFLKPKKLNDPLLPGPGVCVCGGGGGGGGVDTNDWCVTY